MGGNYLADTIPIFANGVQMTIKWHQTVFRHWQYKQMEVSLGAKAVTVYTNRWKNLMRHCIDVVGQEAQCAADVLCNLSTNNLYTNDKFVVCCWDCLTHSVAFVLTKAARKTAKWDNSSLSSVLFPFGPHLFLWWILTPLCERKQDQKNMNCYFLMWNTYLIVEGRTQRHNYLHRYHKAWQCALHCTWPVRSPPESLCA